MDRQRRPRLPQWLPVALSILLVLILVLITHESLLRLDDLTLGQQRAYQTLHVSQALLGDLTDVQRGVHGHILSGREDALALYRKSAAAVPLELAELRQLLDHNDRDRALYREVDTATYAVLTYAQQLLSTYEREGIGAVSRTEAAGTGLVAMDLARARLIAVSGRSRTDLEGLLHASARALSWMQWQVTIGAIMVLGLLMLAYFDLRRSAHLSQGAAQRLLHMEQRFRYLVDGVEDYALLMVNKDGAVLSWNTGAQRLYGYTAEEIIGQHFSCFYPLQARAAGDPDRELEVAAREGRYEEEGVRVRKDGTQFMVNVIVSAVRNQDGELRGFAKITRDITEIRRRDEAIAEQAQILDLANDTIFVRDMQDRITYWNHGAQRVYGWTRKEAVGQVTHELLQTRFALPLPEIQATLASTGHWEGELEHTRKDGSRLTVASHWTQQRDQNGEVKAIIEMNYDISDRKRITQALEEKNAQLLQASHAKDTFLASMSHELRTPLNGIIGFSELLVDGLAGPVNEKQKEFLGDVLDSGHHLLQLINDVLDLAKVGAGKMQIYPESFALAPAVDEACQVLRQVADGKEIALLQSLSPRVQNACLDRQRFKQILFNLLSNAVKFTDRGGTVEISTLPLAADQFMLSIRDTGIGIAPENIRRLFREFEQIDSGAARHYQGTGLGLALTRKLVSLQDGTISVVSEPGKGTTFTVTLPLRCAGSTQTVATLAPEDEPASGARKPESGGTS